MKTLTPDDADFAVTLRQVCEIMPKIRFIARGVHTIQQSPKGIRFLDANGEQLAALTAKTIKEEQEALNATFRN
ncbi:MULTISPECIES: hypothetical protein [Bacteria]|uniref:Uncharacterized protein n=2 Tax=Bacteria TaxID=2 RepID=A0ABX5L0N8_9GAMM|nr:MULTISPECIES: hypothetical protein [Bacteria]PWD90367.1 hypothetical protein DC079_04295 [Ignatzschineria cameli]PWD92250.1 hypothetical protein DC081_04000 [Ignatzschineria cameli]PWD93044.1 hypothetical protein DC078_04295 [Ignatzschineria cameli]TWS23154.1 hypothetical protein FK530_24520 [Tsukamurella conjunctivitidis]